jgi:phosphoribosylformimino-5-aminoimidazole carboxamide ribotide isomerase
VLTRKSKAPDAGPPRVIPAVDVLGDEAVRLHRGDYGRVTSSNAEPLELVARYARAGAEIVHLVDLSGAREGRIRPELVRRAVASASPARVQASGGIRSLRDAEVLVDAGAARVVVGTAAFGDGDALARFAEALGDRLVVAVDVRDERVAIGGWTRTTRISVDDAVERCLAAGARRLLCTAIDRDGTLAGPAVALVERVVKASHLPVLAAGGVRSGDDLAALGRTGCEAVVVGRALLDGVLPLSVVRSPPWTDETPSASARLTE